MSPYQHVAHDGLSIGDRQLQRKGDRNRWSYSYSADQQRESVFVADQRTRAPCFLLVLTRRANSPAKVDRRRRRRRRCCSARPGLCLPLVTVASTFTCKPASVKKRGEEENENHQCVDIYRHTRKNVINEQPCRPSRKKIPILFEKAWIVRPSRSTGSKNLVRATGLFVPVNTQARELPYRSFRHFARNYPVSPIQYKVNCIALTQTCNCDEHTSGTGPSILYNLPVSRRSLNIEVKMVRSSAHPSSFRKRPVSKNVFHKGQFWARSCGMSCMTRSCASTSMAMFVSSASRTTSQWWLSPSIYGRSNTT
ncbi:unnamed protein product, partial [Trichogramma brassicae]